MNNMLLFSIVLLLSACATKPNITQGENPGKKAIVILKIDFLPENSPYIPDDKAVYQQVRKNPLWGPIRQFKFEKGNPLSVTTLEPGIWEWYLIRNLKFNGSYENNGTQSRFQVKFGCINLLADLTVDMRDSVMKISENPPNEATLEQFKSKYPKMFDANSVCPNVY